MAPEFRPHQARLLYRAEPRLNGAWYPVDLDRRAGGDLDTTYARLEELFRRLTKLDGATGRDLDFYELDVQSVPDDGRPFRWVPHRPDNERRGWR